MHKWTFHSFKWNYGKNSKLLMRFIYTFFVNIKTEKVKNFLHMRQKGMHDHWKISYMNRKNELLCFQCDNYCSENVPCQRRSWTYDMFIGCHYLRYLIVWSVLNIYFIFSAIVLNSTKFFCKQQQQMLLKISFSHLFSN